MTINPRHERFEQAVRRLNTFVAEQIHPLNLTLAETTALFADQLQWYTTWAVKNERRLAENRAKRKKRNAT